MKNLKGTKTEKNLLVVFSEECQAPNKYTFLQKEGYEKINAYFTENIKNEEHHENLSEKYNSCANSLDFKKMAAEAREEGFETIAQYLECLIQNK